MLIDSEIIRKYSEYEGYLDQVAIIVQETLLNYCKKEHYAYLARKKTLQSLSEKIESGRYKEWSDIDDLFAASIVIPNYLTEDSVLTFLQDVFETKLIKKRGSTKKPPDVFRFDSTRFIGTLKNDGGKSSDLLSISFEVQIKTAFEHAWSVATHPLTYKSNEIDWRMLRLAAQIKSNVEQMDMLVIGADIIKDKLNESQWPEVILKKQIIDKIVYFKENGIIPEEIIPKDLNRFCDNIYSLISSYENLGKKVNDESINKFFDLIETEFKKYTDTTFPRTLSLFQHCFAILYINNEVKIPSNSYYLITPNMESLYSTTSTIVERFIY